MPQQHDDPVKFDAVYRELAAARAELTEARREQAASAQVLQAISRSLDLDAILESLVASARDLCEAPQSMILLRDGDVLRMEKQVGYPPAFERYVAASPPKIAPTSGAGGAVYRREVVHFPDVLEDESYRYSEGQKIGGYRALLSVPLLRDNDAIGVFSLGRPTPGPFSERQIELVKIFADQAVIAIENARLFREVQARTRDLEEALAKQTSTAEILRVISQSPTDARPVFESIVVAAARVLRCDMAFVMLVEGESWSNAAVATPEGLGEVALSETFPVDPDLNFPSRAIVAKAMVSLPDWSALQMPDHQRRVQDLYGIEASLHLPFLREGTCVGVLTLLSRRAFAFGEAEILESHSFRDQAMIAVENARLFNETQEALAQQTATADVLKVISRSAFDLQIVLDTLVSSAATLCEAEKACIFLRRGEDYGWVSNFGFSKALVDYAATHPFQAGSGAATSRVARDRTTVHIPDVLADPNYQASEYQRLGDYRTMLGVPLLRDGDPIGVFIMTRHDVKPFNARQIELLQTFADQAVIAIENSRLLDEVQARTHDVEQSLADLRKTQDRLVQSEKLASLGQLTAGIAHEIKNPLNFVNNFASLSRELLDELREVLERLPDDARSDADDLLGLIGSNLEKVASHGKRADSIIKNMLLHSREGSGERTRVTVNAMIEEALNLGYHGARAEKPGFNVTIEKSFDPDAGEAELFLQEITRVLLNLMSNGFYATDKRRQTDGPDYEPTLTATTRDLGHNVEIRIHDNGVGIPDEVRAKMFNPFFTTKPAGEGTGLGLSLSHDIIVKQHGGTLDVETTPGAFTEFVITLPRKATRA